MDSSTAFFIPSLSEWEPNGLRLVIALYIVLLTLTGTA